MKMLVPHRRQRTLAAVGQRHAEPLLGGGQSSDPRCTKPVLRRSAMKAHPLPGRDGEEQFVVLSSRQSKGLGVFFDRFGIEPASGRNRQRRKFKYGSDAAFGT